MARRRFSSPSFGHALLATMLVCVQLLLPAVHAQHLASHAKGSHAAEAACCHHHPHDQPEHPDAPDDESCTLCLELAIVRHGSLSLDGPSVVWNVPLVTAVNRVPSLVDRPTPELCTGPPRGPPTA